MWSAPDNCLCNRRVNNSVHGNHELVKTETRCLIFNVPAEVVGWCDVCGALSFDCDLIASHGIHITVNNYSAVEFPSALPTSLTLWESVILWTGSSSL